LIYRPQFVYAIPRGCSEDGYEHYFDTTIVPAQTVSTTGNVMGILFQIDFKRMGLLTTNPADFKSLRICSKNRRGIFCC